MYQGFFRDLQSIMGKLDYRTLRENVADEIRMKILNGDMKPGDKIIEQELASEFGISRRSRSDKAQPPATGRA